MGCYLIMILNVSVGDMLNLDLALQTIDRQVHCIEYCCVAQIKGSIFIFRVTGKQIPSNLVHWSNADVTANLKTMLKTQDLNF